MKQVLLKNVLVGLVLMGLMTPMVWAQKRVKFPKGQTSVILKGRTTGGPSESGGMNPVAYVFRARRGQHLTLRLTSARKHAVFGLYAPGMELVEGAQGVTDWSGELPATGDYEIIVFPEDERTNTTFALEITIV
ncbi:MAG: hypothetical protein SNJ67_09755 [Chloracidobacterium sp.]|uniref:Uncharacterized protein n=1 Tax=Chloracidobacterium validum TaxID=2821543 RepID=A0ABX8B822_9BACT|nr:hypothetical protein [Chloracidobacterium validum]QUW02839.1 hypothetical protein J8C06_10975 [Chloracidobacterium validum]